MRTRRDNDVRIAVDGTDRYGPSVSIGLGTDPRGRRVVFVGDARMMGRIQEELDSGTGPVSASVPSWAILTTSPDPPAA